MRNRIITIAIAIGVVSIVNSQNYKFGKVSKEELKEVLNPMDSTANATILYSNEKIHYEYNVDDGFLKYKEVQKRIKIYNKEGLEWAVKELMLYNKSSSNKELLTDLKAVTYNLESEKIEETKLRKNGIFEEEVNDYWKKIKFSLPNVKEGSVIEYKYSITSPFTLSIDDVELQETIPIKKIDCRIAIPEYFNFKTYYNPKSTFLPEMKTSSKKESKHVSWTEQTYGLGGKKTKYEKDLEYKVVIKEVNEVNVPALKDEAYVSNLEVYKSKFSFELLSTKSFNYKFTSYSDDWDSVTKYIYDNQYFGGQLEKGSYYKEDLETLLKQVNTDQEKIAFIFNFVKNKVKWNGNLGYYADKGVRKTYKEGVGNVADINLILISMLRVAGINANPILLSTKSNGIPLYPTRKGFNYVICGVELNNQVVLLDASRKYNTINIIDEELLNWQGRIVREHGSSTWVNINPKKNSIYTCMIEVQLNDDLVFEGKLRTQQKDYLAYNYRKKYAGLAKDDLIRAITSDKGELEVKNLEVLNENNLSKPIMMSYDFDYDGSIEEIGNELYLSPLLFFTETENVFNSDERNYPVDFVFPKTNKTIINMGIPEGYKVKSLPNSIKLMMSDNLGVYSFIVKNTGRKLQILQDFAINTPIVPVNYYQELQKIYSTFIKKNTAKIVLEKI